ncbi:flagellar hook capping FlgD N-terminal domain-containing protein [Microbulbifer rhizosphaerae]|uniref:Basal-body rod modification protein FlgD n=1 Tax=Microbulbifer rhizosphaerae TaxID=1562603 RepID=A0A7W4WFZ2_9GAMM|nr:flagellar hook capping FlgD N-terminal domain-containing protein [Microbulbifer rhizosphaerae]MBB3063497.1 flagellar basal-body rod modification protein FlgD [Microbulbifer rhizosphaerae]
MPVDAVGQVAGTQSLNEQSAVNLDEFLRIFITQLNYQDPLDPVDNREFITQLAEFSNLELSRATQSDISDLLEVNAVSQSLALLGKTVEINGQDGAVIGNVSSIRFSQGAPLLSVVTGNNEIIPDLSPSEIRIIRE